MNFLWKSLFSNFRNEESSRGIPLTTAQASFNEGRCVVKVISYQVANQCGKGISV